MQPSGAQKNVSSFYQGLPTSDKPLHGSATSIGQNDSQPSLMSITGINVLQEQ